MTCVLTTCRPDNRRPMYEELVKPLVTIIKSLVPNSRYTQRTYAYKDPAVPLKIRGAVVVQYTPYDHDSGDDDCTPQARVRMFYETNKVPIVDKSWTATTNQINSKTRRDACSEYIRVLDSRSLLTGLRQSRRLAHQARIRYFWRQLCCRYGHRRHDFGFVPHRFRQRR